MSDEVFCIHCGQPTAASGRFCRKCGADQSPNAEKASPQSHPNMTPQLAIEPPAVLLNTPARQTVGGILVFVGVAVHFMALVTKIQLVRNWQMHSARKMIVELSQSQSAFWLVSSES